MTLSKEEKMLAKGNINSLFLKFGIPGVLGLLFIGFQPMVDGIFLIKYVGPDALAGVNLFVPVYTFVSALAVVIGIGCQTVVSISLGEKNYHIANDAFKTAAIFLLGFMILVAAVSILWTEPISKALGANADLQPFTIEYIRNFAPFLPILALLFLGDYMLKASVRPYLALILLGLILLLNIIFDYLFVAILALGVKGAAWATGIALSSSFIITCITLLDKNNMVNFHHGHFRKSLLGKMIYNGSSEGLLNSLPESLSFFTTL